MKKRVPITVEYKKTVERKNNFLAGSEVRKVKMFDSALTATVIIH